MRIAIAVALALVCGLSTADPGPRDELADLRARIREATSTLKDVRANVVLKKSNRRELEKMGKVFAETYQFKQADISFAMPDKLRINGELGMVKVVFITAGNTRRIRFTGYKKTEDITDEQQKRMTSIDVGVVTDAIWDLCKVTLVRTEKGDDGRPIYVLKLETPKSKKSQLLWLDGKDLRLLRRDRLLDAGELKVKIVFSGHKQVGGLWIPTVTEVYNGEDKLAAVSGTSDIKINSGVADKEFE